MAAFRVFHFLYLKTIDIFVCIVDPWFLNEYIVFSSHGLFLACKFRMLTDTVASKCCSLCLVKLIKCAQCCGVVDTYKCTFSGIV